MRSSFAVRLVRENAFFAISSALAFGSAILVPPDLEYWGYFEARTLVSLLCILVVIQGLDRAGLITSLAELAIKSLATRRGLVVGLVAVTLVGSMIISNDVALISFLPLSYAALQKSGNGTLVPRVFVLQAAAANLGGMITPFGSPQNLYLYQRYEISFSDFVAAMSIPFALSMLMVFGMALAVKGGPVAKAPVRSSKVLMRPTALYLALFAVAIAVALRVLPTWTGFLVVGAALMADRSALTKVDWGLIGTLFCSLYFRETLRGSTRWTAR